MEPFARLTAASELCLVVAPFAPSTTIGVDGNAGTWSQLLARPSRDLHLAPLKTSRRPPAAKVYSVKSKVVAVSS
jgi:hypothetical protein